jgi:lipopolysaccharide/colanic/teichoic acid biosynthesis glycosyltransferase
MVGETAAMMKRAMDVTVAAVGLLLSSPLFAVVTLLIRLTSPGPAIFRQERMGRGFRPFMICKFRTMVQDAPQRGSPLTCGDDQRITRIGRILRKFKIDELPQLYNVLRGDMSLVGPRPELPRYVEMFRDDYAEILRLRPGITDLASLEYCDEATILGRAADPQGEYVRRILPEKIRLARHYVERSSCALDAAIILTTVFRICRLGLTMPGAGAPGKGDGNK